MKNRAFTLIELLVVVLIIGILATIAVPQYRKAVAKSQFATLKFMVKDIVQAQEAYYLANGKYTKNFSELDISLPTPNSTEDASIYQRYRYDWGMCLITEYHTICSNNKVSMNMDFYFDNASSTPKKKVCTVQGTTDLNDYRNNICKEETGAETGSIDNSSKVIYWYYQ